MPPNRSAAASIIALTLPSSATSTCVANALPLVLGDRLFRRLQVHVGGADLCALLGEEQGGVAAHPAAGSRDHADLAVEAPHHPSVE